MTTLDDETRDLCVRNVRIPVDVLEYIFKKFGTFVFHRLNETNIYFAKYEYIEHAKTAIEQLKNNSYGFHVDFALDRTLRNSTKNSPKRSGLRATDISNGSRTFYCVVCDQIGQQSCGRCGECYCSEKCQVYDWKYNSHIINCVPIAPLVPINENVHTIARYGSKLDQMLQITNGTDSPQSSNELPPATSMKRLIRKSENSRSTIVKPKFMQLETNSTVILTHASYDNNQWRIYVRPANDDQYIEILQRIDEEGKTARRLEQAPELPTVVIAPYEGHFYRALAKGPDKFQNYRVDFWDFGNEETVPFEDLYEISERSRLEMRYVQKLCLKKIPKGWNEAVQVFLEGLTDSDTELTLRFDGQFHSQHTLAELYDGQDCINDQLRSLFHMY